MEKERVMANYTVRALKIKHLKVKNNNLFIKINIWNWVGLCVIFSCLLLIHQDTLEKGTVSCLMLVFNKICIFCDTCFAWYDDVIE